MQNKFLLFFLFCASILTAQHTLLEQINTRLIDLHQVANNDENFEGYEGLQQAIGDAEIVMLGEQSHGEGTTFETKIKLIKYLHQEMGFDLLAFESNLYECQRAWSMVQEGQEVKNALGKGIFSIWSATEELVPLFQYVEQQLATERPLMIAGFDNQMMAKISSDHFVDDLTAYIATFTKAAIYEEELLQLQVLINFIRQVKIKKYKKKNALANIAFLEELEQLIHQQPTNDLSSFWLQTLKNLKGFISDMKLGTDVRDQQMAENLIWLKEKYPDKKIICWGATSHFLYNSSQIRMKSKVAQLLAANYYKKHSMMGDYIKERYGDKVYTIGFTAYQGYFGSFGSSEIKAPEENSLEFLMGQAPNDNYFLPLANLSLEGYLSRPLGNYYMTNNISQVMDGVVFNRTMKRPYIDYDFFMYLVPENKYIPKKLARLKENNAARKLKDQKDKKIIYP